MEYIESYLSDERICENKTITSLKKTIDLNDEFFNFYLKISNKYCHGILKDRRPLAIIFLNHKILKSLHCLSGLLKKGQYSEFHSILRDVLEMTSKCQYILEKPEISKQWLKGEEIHFSKVSKQIALPESINKLYGELCDFTHANIRSSIYEITIHRKEIAKGVYGMKLSTKPVFEKPIAYSLLMYLITFNIIAIFTYFKFIKDHCENIDDKDNDEFESIIKKLPIIEKSYSKYCSNPKNTEWNRTIKFKK